jgi:hypothetical protein
MYRGIAAVCCAPDNDSAKSAALQLMAHRGRAARVHKILFSMPPGAPRDKLLTAVRNLAQQEFADRHRYALALHTDERATPPRPHGPEGDDRGLGVPPQYP